MEISIEDMSISLSDPSLLGNVHRNLEGVLELEFVDFDWVDLDDRHLLLEFFGALGPDRLPLNIPSHSFQE